MKSILTKNIIVSGRVQGVAFRYYTLLKAQELKLVGQVQNLPSGQVEIIAQGDAQAIQKFIDWLPIGSPASNVNNVQSSSIESIKSNTFIIKR